MRQGTLYLPPNTKMPQLASVFGMLATICGLFTEFHSIIPTFKLVAAALLTLAAILPVEKQYASMLLPAGLLISQTLRIPSLYLVLQQACFRNIIQATD